MISFKDIETAIRQANCVAPEPLRRRIWQDAAKKRQPSSPAPSRTAIWRIAAVLVLATVPLLMLVRSTTPAYALTDAAAAFDRARVIHVQGLEYFPGYTFDDGQPVPPVPLDYWVDRNGSRARKTDVSLCEATRRTPHGVVHENVKLQIGESIYDGSYLMEIDHTAKTIAFARITPYHRKLMTYWQSGLLWGELCGHAMELEDFAKVGREKVSGITYDLWQLDFPTPRDSSERDSLSPQSWRMKLWLSGSDGRLRRAQAWQQAENGSWLLKVDWHTIEYDVAVPPETFATEPPKGYTAKDSKETAPARTARWGSGGICLAQGDTVPLEYHVLAGFTLADGSVIVAWQSFQPRSEESQTQTPSFENLTFGGPLPQLPIEFYALRPVGPSNGVIYTGYHLGYTQKSGDFIEWSLYVPAGTPPRSVRQTGYEILCRFHAAPRAPEKIDLHAPFGVLIRTAEDFDEWVRGAMAEFSENGQAPEALTYQAVTELAQHLRMSLKP